MKTIDRCHFRPVPQDADGQKLFAGPVLSTPGTPVRTHEDQIFIYLGEARYRLATPAEREQLVPPPQPDRAFTPGPWVAAGSTVQALHPDITDRPWYIDIFTDRALTLPAAEMAGNARLAAAAPELLALVQKYHRLVWCTAKGLQYTPEEQVLQDTSASLLERLQLGYFPDDEEKENNR